MPLRTDKKLTAAPVNCLIENPFVNNLSIPCASKICYSLRNVTNGEMRHGCVSKSDISVCDGNYYNHCPPYFKDQRTMENFTSVCCCNKSECNGMTRNFKRAQQSTNYDVQSGAGWIKSVTVFGGVILVLIAVGSVSIAIKHHWKRQTSKKGSLSANVSDKDPSSEFKDDSMENSENGMECGPGRPVGVSVIHIDRTDTSVPSQLTSEEQTILIESFKKIPKLKKVDTCKNPPIIDRVITYGTSDDITVSESMNQSDTEWNDEEPLLTRLILNGPKAFKFNYYELKKLLERGADVFLHEPSLLEVPLPCVVYGDIHGQYSDLLRWFNLNGWPCKVRCVFLGDFVDRGSHGIEVIALLVALKLRFPMGVFICRGNHEEESLNKAYSFFEEVCLRFPDHSTSSSSSSEGNDGKELYAVFKRLFNALPLAVLIGKRILGMHGGISPLLSSLDAIRGIQRPLEEFKVGSLACDLVWSDPDIGPNHSGYRKNFEREPVNGIGQLFASDVVQAACRRLGIDMVIRGHQAPLHGYALFSNSCMMTLFSAPGYKGTTEKDINMGASLEISSRMHITIKQLKVTEEFRRKRVLDNDRMKTLRKNVKKS